jgi:hypothetical protein
MGGARVVSIGLLTISLACRSVSLPPHDSGWVVGLVYLVIPAIFSEETRVRFSRVPCPGPDG